MQRRTLLKLLGAAPSVFARAAAARPNIVLMVGDDLGYGDLSSYGAPDIRTPNIDGIAQRGLRFTRFYSNGPECSPTRSALMTGRYQQRIGGLECAIGVGNVGRYDDAEWLAKRHELGVPVSETSMPRMLKDGGYATACFGKWHLGYEEKFSPNRHGFDEYFGIIGGNADYFTHREEDGFLALYQNGKQVERKGYTTDLIAQEALAWLKRRPARQPFFLYVPFTAPHTPIQDPDTGREQQGDRKIYAKMVEREDQRIGEILAALPPNTLVIYHSDNGADPNGRNDPLRGRKGTLWEGGIRVPCVMEWAGVLPRAKTVTQAALTMDLLPTILAATGVAAPAGRKFDGVNLMPALTGKRPDFARTLFWRSKRGTRVRKAVCEGDLKLVIDEGEEMHDLAADLSEKKNLLPGRAADAARLKAKLAAWERDVMAPRLSPFKAIPG